MSRGPRETSIPTADAEWIAGTCLPERPDTTGWQRYRFGEFSIQVPPGYAVNERTNPRSISFRRGTGTLTLWIATQVRSIGLYARPARPANEASCVLGIGFFTATIGASAYENRYNVDVEWDGRNFWAPDDWRKWLRANVTATRLHDATVLRKALYTIRLDRDSGP